MFGISKERQQTRPPDRADALADIVLLDHDGKQVRLGDLWGNRLSLSSGAPLRLSALPRPRGAVASRPL